MQGIKYKLKCSVELKEPSNKRACTLITESPLTLAEHFSLYSIHCTSGLELLTLYFKEFSMDFVHCEKLNVPLMPAGDRSKSDDMNFMHLVAHSCRKV